VCGCIRPRAPTQLLPWQVPAFECQVPAVEQVPAHPHTSQLPAPTRANQAPAQPRPPPVARQVTAVTGFSPLLGSLTSPFLDSLMSSSPVSQQLAAMLAGGPLSSRQVGTAPASSRSGGASNAGHAPQGQGQGAYGNENRAGGAADPTGGLANQPLPTPGSTMLFSPMTWLETGRGGGRSLMDLPVGA
jgi:hypothetical protein